MASPGDPNDFSVIRSEVDRLIQIITQSTDRIVKTIIGTKVIGDHAGGTATGKQGILSKVTEKLTGAMDVLYRSTMLVANHGFKALVMLVKTFGEQLVRSIGHITVWTLGLAVAANQLVRYFDPTTAMLFDTALKNVAAVIGSAFAPAIQVVTGLFDDVSSVLAPLADRLAPLLASVAKIVADILLPAFKVLGLALELFAPLLAGIAQVLQVLTTTLSVTINSIIDAIRPLINFIGDGLGAVIGMFASVLRAGIKALLAIFAGLSKTFVGTGPTERLIENFQKQADHQKELRLAPQDFAVKDFESIIRDVNLAAAGASGAMPKSQDEFLQEMIEVLKEVRDGKNILDIIYEAILKAWREIKSAAVDSIIPSFQGAPHREGAGPLERGWDNFMSTIPEF